MNLGNQNSFFAISVAISLLAINLIDTSPAAAKTLEDPEKAKAVQCQMLTDAVLKANYAVNDLDDADDHLKFYEVLSIELASFETSDTMLRTIRDVALLEIGDSTKLVKQLVKAKELQDEAAIAKIEMRIELARAGGKELTSQLNDYCY